MPARPKSLPIIVRPVRLVVPFAAGTGPDALQRSDSLIEFQPVGNPISRESVHHKPFLIGRDDLLGRIFEIDDSLFDINDAVHDGDLEVQPRLGDHAHRLAKAYHKRLVGLINCEHSAVY